MKQDWVNEFKKELKDHVEQTIGETVNGKLDRIKDRLDKYIEQDLEWKQKAQPAIDTFINLRGGYKSILVFSAFLVAVGAAVTVIKKAIGLWVD